MKNFAEWTEIVTFAHDFWRVTLQKAVNSFLFPLIYFIYAHEK